MSIETSIQNVHAVPLGVARNTVDMVSQLGNFCLNHSALVVGHDTVGRLNTQFSHALQTVRNCGKSTFSSVYKALHVKSIVGTHVKSAHL